MRRSNQPFLGCREVYPGDTHNSDFCLYTSAEVSWFLSCRNPMLPEWNEHWMFLEEGLQWFPDRFFFLCLVCVFFLYRRSRRRPCPPVTTRFPGFEFYVTDDASVGLYKPKGWQVGTQAYPNGKMVFVTDQRDLCLANMVLLEKIDPALDSVAFARATLANMKKQMPDLKVVESRSSVDRTRTVVKIERKGQDGVPIRGRCFNVKVPLASMIGYEAPARDFRKTVPTLLTILSNIYLLDNQAYRKMEARMKRRSPAVLEMHRATARDGTCRLLVPGGMELAVRTGGRDMYCA